jgi:hypothetical protein
LTDKIKSLIPWETMSATITTETFKRIRDCVLSLKEDAAKALLLVSMPALRQRLADTDPGWRFSAAEAITAVRHLETHGYVHMLRSTDGNEFVLLAPELLSKLASSIVLEARRETHGLGALDEARLLEGDYRLPELDGLDHGQRRILLDAVTLLFLKHNVCFREYLGNNVLLVFPALINERRPLISDTPTVEDVSYALTGAVENVYAALAVLLGYTNTFTRTNQWQNQAQYELGPGEICGFRQIDQGKGAVQLILYYGATTPNRAKLLFQGLFETFLVRKDLSIVRYRPVICPDCGEHQDRAVIMKQIERGRTFIFCVNCGSKTGTPKPDDLTVTITGNEEMHQQRQVAARRTAFEASLVSVKSLLLERGDGAARPTCFISYAWGVPEHESWVLQLAKDLRNADIDVILDRWHSPPGSDLGRYIERITSSQFVIVIGTPELRRKYDANSADPVVAAELELVSLRLRQPQHYGRTVLPILLEGNTHEAFTPMLQKLVNIDLRQEEVYFPRLLSMIWQLYSLPSDHPILEDLRASMDSATYSRSRLNTQATAMPGGGVLRLPRSSGLRGGSGARGIPRINHEARINHDNPRPQAAKGRQPALRARRGTEARGTQHPSPANGAGGTRIPGRTHDPREKMAAHPQDTSGCHIHVVRASSAGVTQVHWWGWSVQGVEAGG